MVQPSRDLAGGGGGGGSAATGPSLDTSLFDGVPATEADDDVSSSAGGSTAPVGGGAAAAADASSSQASSSTSAAAAAAGASAPSSSAPSPLYHVAAVDQGLNLEPETLTYWGYDDGTSTLLVAKGGLVFAYDMSAAAAPPGSNPDGLRWTFPLAEGGPVRSMRLSLDGGLLAIQRSPVMIEFVELASGNVFVQGTDRGRGEILAFFFTELEGSEVVLVTPGGLELLEFVTRRQGLRMRERIRVPVEWALYTHETRMVLLGTSGGGTPSGYIKAFQFVSSGLVALPPFTAGVAAAAAALMGAGGSGAAAAGLVAGSPLAAAAVATPPTRVAAESLRLVKVYGRVYCAHINRRALRLELYRFYTDTVVLQHTYELFSPDVELAVVDSVIVAVCATATAGSGAATSGTAETAETAAAAAAVAAPPGGGGGLTGVAMLFDVAAPTLQPIANPLPVQILPTHGHAGPAVAAAAAATGAGAPPGRRWEYLAPNVVLDRDNQTAYRLALNLQAVAESSSDPAIAVGFLQRRRGPSVPAAGAAAAAGPSPKALLLSVVRNALQERMPLPTLRTTFEDLCAGYAAALDRELSLLASAAAAVGIGGGLAAAAGLPPPPPPPPPAASVMMPQYVTADELASELFRWLHDEEVVDAPYLQAALYEYMSAAAAAGIPLPPYLQELSVEVLLQQSQDSQVLQLLYGQSDAVAPALVQRLVTPPAPGQGPGPAPHPLPGAGDEGTAAAQEAAPAAAAAEGGRSGGSTGGAAASRRAAAAAPEGPLCRQVGVDAMARDALEDRYEPVAAAAAAWLQPAAAAVRASAASPGAAAGAYVEALVAQGDVLRAARVMRRYRVARPSIKEFIAMVGARGDEVALAAVYRTFQDELLACYPKYDLAVRRVLAPPLHQATPQQQQQQPQPAAVTAS